MDTVEGSGRRPSQRIADDLRRDIDSGKYTVGAALPSYRELMATYNVALNTAQAAVEILERGGRVRREHGKRTRVIEPSEPTPAEAQLRQLREELVTLRAELRGAGGVIDKLDAQLGGLVDRIATP